MVEAGLYDAQDPSTLPRLLATLRRSRYGLVEAMKQCEFFEPGTNLLVVVDQFEELFRFRQQGIDFEETAAAFVNLLLTASEQAECPIYVTITMRSDYLGDCSEIPGLAEAVNEGEYLIPRLARDQKRDAIEKPIGVGGAKISPLLVQRLLNDVGDDPDQLPVLQHALSRMWDGWSRNGATDRPIEIGDFEATGGLGAALSNHADEICDALPDDGHRSVCERIFKALTQKGEDNRGIRRPTRLAHLQAIVAAPRDTVIKVLDAYRDHGVTFLMPGPEVELGDRTVLDLSHESLMRCWQRLRGWVEDEAQSARIYRRLLETARLWKDGKAGLFHDPDLQIALSWREHQTPTAAWAEEYGGDFAAAMEFLDLSHADVEARRQASEAARQRELAQARELAEFRQQRLEQQQRSTRRLRQLIAVLSIVALIAGVACVLAVIANQRASRLANQANQSAQQAKSSEREANLARAASENSQAIAEAEAYRAVFSEARALRAGRQPGWRGKALADLARLASSPSPNRNLLELRTEAVAALGTPDVRLVARIAQGEGSHSFTFGPDGRTLVTVGPSGNLDFWDLHERKHVAATQGLGVQHPPRVWDRNRVIYLPGNQGLAVTTRDQGVVFTDPSGNRADRPPITRGNLPASQVAVDAAGTRVAVGWVGGGVTVHDLATGEVLEQATGTACALSPDGQWLAHQGPQNEVRLRSIGSQDAEKSLGHHDGNIARFAFSPDGNALGSASRDGTAIIWDVAGRRQPVVLRGHRETINDLAFSPDGGWVVTASTDFTARVWDVLTGQSLATLPGQWFMLDVGWSSDGAFLAVGGDTSSIALYEVTGRQISQRLVRHRNGVQCVASNPRLERFATGADDHCVFDWNVAAHRPIAGWSETETQYVLSLAYSPDGSLLATGTGYGSLVVRDAETGAIKIRLQGHDAGIPAISFDTAGQRLASGDRNGRVFIWDVATGEKLQELKVGNSWVWSIVFLDEGRKLISEVSNGALVQFDLESGKSEKSVTLPGGIRRFVSDPARQRLIAAFNNGDLLSLSIPDMTPGKRLKRAHPSAIESLALSPDGRVLATGGADRRVVFRDPITFEPLLAYPDWTAMVKDLAFTPSGRWLAYVGADSDVALWDLAQLHEGLRAAGLAWDQPATKPVPSTTEGGSEQVPTEVPIIGRPRIVDQTTFDLLRDQTQSGISALENGRPAEAIRDLTQARDKLRTLHKLDSSNAQVNHQFSLCLGYLASALRDQSRPIEALECLQEARQVLEATGQPSAVDLYNLACVYASLSTLAEPGSTQPSPTEREDLAVQAVTAIRRAIAAGMTDFELLQSDHDLDPLRERADFRALVHEANGRIREAVPELAAMAAANPNDTLLSLKVAALQAWFGQDQELAATRQRILLLAKGTSDATTAERVAKACSILPYNDAEQLEATLALAQMAVTGGGDGLLRQWYLLALGMAEYRSGNYSTAEKALVAATAAGPDNQIVAGTSDFYRSMSLFRQDKAEEARALAIEAAAKMKPLPEDEQNPLTGNASHDDLILWLAFKEAQALMQFDSGNR
jgi:WD40 repeat protein/tetratricopeptide (TPR) repeat protein